MNKFEIIYEAKTIVSKLNKDLNETGRLSREYIVQLLPPERLRSFPLYKHKKALLDLQALNVFNISISKFMNVGEFKVELLIDKKKLHYITKHLKGLKQEPNSINGISKTIERSNFETFMKEKLEKYYLKISNSQKEEKQYWIRQYLNTFIQAESFFKLCINKINNAAKKDFQPIDEIILKRSKSLEKIAGYLKKRVESKEDIQRKISKQIILYNDFKFHQLDQLVNMDELEKEENLIKSILIELKKVNKKLSMNVCMYIKKKHPNYEKLKLEYKIAKKYWAQKCKSSLYEPWSHMLNFLRHENFYDIDLKSQKVFLYKNRNFSTTIDSSILPPLDSTKSVLLEESLTKLHFFILEELSFFTSSKLDFTYSNITFNAEKKGLFVGSKKIQTMNANSIILDIFKHCPKNKTLDFDQFMKLSNRHHDITKEKKLQTSIDKAIRRLNYKLSTIFNNYKEIITFEHKNKIKRLF